MRYKILTIDDSKTVRIIVRKAFRGYDCEILEASNGVEGLAVASKELPHLILLDVTMPVMDGITMLGKLKTDPALKGIPVIMLTAEGGRDNVLKIARIGVRDYLVKPFKEEVLVAQTSRVIDIKPSTEVAAKAKTIFDSAEILLVEDKEAVAQQIQDGLKHMPWKIYVAANQGAATGYCMSVTPDLVMVSLSLEDESAFELFRQLRGDNKTKQVPVFAIVGKADAQDQQQAQAVGFNSVVTKPVDFADLETKIAKAMGRDTSQRYYAVDGDVTIMRLPQNCTPAALTEVTGYLKSKFSEAVEAGRRKLVIDLKAVKALNAGVTKLLQHAMKTSQELGLQATLAGEAKMIQDCRAVSGTDGWMFFETIEAAKAGFGKSSTNAPQLARAS